ncbi:MAG: DUF4926 domain-containing protein [Parvularcula sp.]|jgi:hypothetical protein|nr:DUF4926 domain-containing protein [Parvularcula sp.]
MIEEHASVVLNRDLPERQLFRGDVGVVVHVHGDGEAYEVEFMTMSGATVAVCTLEAAEVQVANSRMMPHAREMAV